MLRESFLMILATLTTSLLLACSPNNGSSGNPFGNSWSSGSGVPPPSYLLDQENIGSKERVYDLFDRWTLSNDITAGRGRQFAEVTAECWGKIETQFALTAEQWAMPGERAKYFGLVDAEIQNSASRLLHTMGDPLPVTEAEVIVRTLKSLAWQESHWQHGLRYKDWFFVILSGGSYNALDDWGMTQVARSGFNASDPLNTDFFASSGHCLLSQTLDYGFTEYLINYMEARTLECNDGSDPMLKILGAYNRYSSGFSLCYDELSDDPAFRDYQMRAMNGLKKSFMAEPWKKLMSATDRPPFGIF